MDLSVLFIMRQLILYSLIKVGLHVCIKSLSLSPLSLFISLSILFYLFVGFLLDCLSVCLSMCLSDSVSPLISVCVLLPQFNITVHLLFKDKIFILKHQEVLLIQCTRKVEINNSPISSDSVLTPTLQLASWKVISYTAGLKSPSHGDNMDF